jgi:hypothetical protein
MHSVQIFLRGSLARNLTLGVGLVQSDLFCLYVNYYVMGAQALSSPAALFRFHHNTILSIQVAQLGVRCGIRL